MDTEMLKVSPSGEGAVLSPETDASPMTKRLRQATKECAPAPRTVAFVRRMRTADADGNVPNAGGEGAVSIYTGRWRETYGTLLSPAFHILNNGKGESRRVFRARHNYSLIYIFSFQ